MLLSVVVVVSIFHTVDYRRSLSVLFKCFPHSLIKLLIDFFENMMILLMILLYYVFERKDEAAFAPS